MRETSIADYWEMLTQKDKEFIIELIRWKFPGKYPSLHIGMIPLIVPNVRWLRLACKEVVLSSMSFSFRTYARFSTHRNLKSSSNRLRKHLSPDLLHQWQKRQAREKPKSFVSALKDWRSQ